MTELWLLPLLCTYNLHVKYFLRIIYWYHCSYQAINLAGSLTICEETAGEILFKTLFSYIQNIFKVLGKKKKIGPLKKMASLKEDFVSKIK